MHVVAGGKGAVSRRTPQELEAAGRHMQTDLAELVKYSRLAAKVDSVAVQAYERGYELTLGEAPTTSGLTLNVVQ
jgi:hypothetical protein